MEKSEENLKRFGLHNMGKFKLENSEKKNPNLEIKVFKYRWIILVLFCLLNVVGFIQMLQFTIISNILVKYYQVDILLVDATGLIFYVVYVVLFLPVSYSIEKYDLRISVILSTFLTLLGVTVKIFCNSPDRMYVVLIGQGLVAIAVVYMMSLPTKLASTWFGADEVSLACAICVFGTQLGTAIGAVLPPFLVRNDQDDEGIGYDIQNMNIYYCIATSITFVLIIMFFQSKPQRPPSQSQLSLLLKDSHPTFLSNCTALIKNRHFIFLLIVLGIYCGLWNGFGILANEFYIHFFPEGETDVGLVNLITIIVGGCIGNLIFGYVLDKTHEFKRTAFVLMFMSSLAFGGVMYTLVSKIRLATYCSIPIFGFFTASVLVISLEYSVEITYPVPESVSCSLMNAVTYLCAVLETLAIEGFLGLIGFDWTFGIIIIILMCCSFGIFLISSPLKRRDANVLVKADNGKREMSGIDGPFRLEGPE